jgi:hypothetical protein
VCLCVYARKRPHASASWVGGSCTTTTAATTTTTIDPHVSHPIRNPPHQAIKNVKHVPFAVAQLAAIRETSVCNYTLTVCTPLLCDATGDPNAPEGAGAAAAVVAPLTGAAGTGLALCV